MTTKLPLFTAILLASLSLQARADIDEAGRSDTGTVEFTCTSPKLSKAKLRLEFLATSKYRGCDQTPTSTPVSAEASVAGLGAKTSFHYGAELITSNGLSESKLPRAQLIEEMKKALPAAAVKACKLAVVPVAEAKAGKNHNERIERRISKIEFQQKVETIAVCREANGKFTVETKAHDLQCTGTDEESSAQYWDNGCV